MLVLQIGNEDWSKTLTLPADVEWLFVDAADPSAADTVPAKRAEATIISAVPDDVSLGKLSRVIAPYTLLVAEELRPEDDTAFAQLCQLKAAQYVDATDLQSLVNQVGGSYFGKQFGQKLSVRSTLVSPLWPAHPTFRGATGLELPVATDVMRPAISWRESINYEVQRKMDLWLEYKLEGDVDLELTVQMIKSGTSDQIVKQVTYTAADMAEPVTFEADEAGYLCCSLAAKGSGTLTVGPLHYRHSRGQAGMYIAGGKRIVDARREELAYYFHPGNLQPPFNVYFAGFRPSEGFEGGAMMAGLGHPFLLITDPRLEGGRFYLGSAELEGKLHQVIRDHIEQLGLTERDVIFSGLAMGAFGALYHGSQFDARAIVAGKPIIDLPYVAERTRLVRPNEFLTVLDIVNFWDQEAPDGTPTTPRGFTDDLVARWSGTPGLGDTEVLISYMLQDDYDDKAYRTLLGSQVGKQTKVIARGYQGRHNDDTPSIVAWFVNQFRRVIAEYEAEHHG